MFNQSIASTSNTHAPAASTATTSRRRHRTTVPLNIDTAKLMSLDLRNTEPIMDALLSPTSLELRYRNKLQDIAVEGGQQIRIDYAAMMRNEHEYQKEVDALADEAEEAFRIGPIVLPDKDLVPGSSNPNKIGWLDELGEEEKAELARQKRKLVKPIVDQEEDDQSQRNRVEQAQFEIVNQIRFVQPRSIAPSQLQDVIAATSSVSKSVDVDEGRLLLPSERNQKPTLQELLAQRDAMVQKLAEDRPRYEGLMDRTTGIFEAQKRAMEERYALI